MTAWPADHQPEDESKGDLVRQHLAPDDLGPSGTA